ncbi:MAG: 2-hydroxychromene-2-carboxylate isomerase [Paracoccaceae bacterium]|jgi:2-hydroxychromene-2-carboxylate isomerase|uniref:2-hydroxychromene-2-carboxylate isomerase n=1 Tax=Roseobacter sp. HKCC-CH-9208 TaxID=3120339 RepID=UPI0030EF0013
MSHIDYYFSTISPYTYLAGKRLEEIAAAHGATIRYRPLDIIALFARTGGTPPAERHPARQAYRLQELQRQSKKTGLALTLKPAFFPTNSAPSSYAIIAAQNEGGGDLAELVHGVTRAVWREEKNIAEDDVIRAALTAAGFDPSLADRGLLSGAEEYAANLEAAVEAGVFGAPFYVVDGVTHFWGQDRLDDLALHLEGKL